MPEFTGKVLLLGNYLPDGQESMRRFANIFLAELPKRGIQVALIRPKRIFGKFSSSKWFGYVDKFVLFPSTLRRSLRNFSAGDVLHICDHSNAVYAPKAARFQRLITCHDLLAIRSASGEFPENPTAASGRLYQRRILRSLTRARRIICVSQATLHDLQRITEKYGVRSQSRAASVIHNCLNFPFAPMDRAEAIALITRKRGAPPARFILHVGGNQWYKNRLGAVHIYRDLRRLMLNPPDLILVGKEWPERLRAEASTRELAGTIHSALEVDGEELRAFYSAADALLFPSLAEGFGWPIIEAQACGCPVAATNRVPMTEVGGNAGIYFDPADSPVAARQVHALLAEAPVKHRERIARGLQNAQRFTVKEMIDRYLAEYAALSE